MIRRRAAMALVAGLAIAPALPLYAQTWPEKPIKLIVPFPPGGGGDNMARLVMGRVAAELGQPIVFENLAGAGGNLGSVSASKAAPDGYTFLYGTNGTFGINQSLYKKPGFSAVNDFEHVSRLTTIAAMVVVRPNFPAQSMADLLKLLKANPGKYTFASAGNGTTSHMAGETLKSAANLAVVHIPYRGGAPAITDVIGGQVDFMIDVMPNTAPQVKGGRLRALAVSTAKRVPGFESVPTIAESGVAGFDVSAWDGIFAPAGTPAAVVEKVNAAIRKVLSSPELQQQLAERGAQAAPNSPQELRAFVTSEVDRWGRAVKRSGASVD
ncbi:tripartite tricarboxylate transporter substrate binding protein [bacterium BD-1]|nr:tripartite tricarboxylate transporter substrate binding protein [Ottowia caeni]